MLEDFVRKICGPSEKEKLLLEASQLYKKGKYDDAIDKFDQVVKNNDNYSAKKLINEHPETNFFSQYIECLQTNGSSKEAIEIIEKTIKIIDENWPHKNNSHVKAYLYNLQGQLCNAIQLENRPSIGHRGLGMIYLSEGNYQKATDAFNKKKNITLADDKTNTIYELTNIATNSLKKIEELTGLMNEQKKIIAEKDAIVEEMRKKIEETHKSSYNDSKDKHGLIQSLNIFSSQQNKKANKKQDVRQKGKMTTKKYKR